MLPGLVDLQPLLNPATAAALQRIAEGVSEAYSSGNCISTAETSNIVAQLAEDGVSDAEMAAARMLLSYARDYVPQLRDKTSRARADEARLREGAEQSPAAKAAWRQAKQELDACSARLREAEAATTAYDTIVEQLDVIRTREDR